MTILKATGPTVASIKFDPARIAALREAERDQLAYHLMRLLTGQGTAESEWNWLGLEIALRPPKPSGIPSG